jgi:hypothetical protein
MAVSFLSDIGNPVKFDNRTDPDNQANTRFKRGMSVVDLIPVSYKLNLSNFDDQDEEKKWIVEYDYDTPISDYQAMCKDYGVDHTGIGGVRCWLTGDTISQEEISNNFGDNFLQKKLNDVSEYGQMAQEVAKSFGSSGEKHLQAGTATLADATKSMGLGPEAGKMLGNLLIEGKHFSLPKVWKDSTYNPSLALNVKLISPYGSQASVYKHVIKPLVQLLILGSPVSDDGLTYGYPKYLHIKAYGITNINLGYIESISINRGGADTTYNIWRQPTSLDLTISIKPALNGFAAVWDRDGKIKDIASVGDAKVPDMYSFPGTGPGITTIGNVINSFRPVPVDIESEGASEDDIESTVESASDFAFDIGGGLKEIEKAEQSILNSVED